MVYNPNLDPPPITGQEVIETNAPRGKVTIQQIVNLASGGGGGFVGPAGTVNASDGSGGGQTTSITDDGSGASIQFAGGDAQMTSNGGASHVSVTAAGDVELLSTNALINLTGAGAINMASSGGAAALDGDGILTVGSPTIGVATAGWLNAELGVAVNGVAVGGAPSVGSEGALQVSDGSGAFAAGSFVDSGAGRLTAGAGLTAELTTDNGTIQVAPDGLITLLGDGVSARLSVDGAFNIGVPTAGVATAGWLNAAAGVAVNGASFSGTITATDLATKTITVVGGIITSFA